MISKYLVICTHLLHEILSQYGEALSIGLLGAFSRHKTLNERLKSLDIVEHGKGPQQEKVLLCQIDLVLFIDITLVGLSWHNTGVAHEKGCFHEVEDVEAFHFSI